MRKTIKLLAAIVFPVLFLTSCEVHIGAQKYDVEWYVIAIPVVLILVLSFVITGIVLSKNTYVCPKCGHKFHPKWWQAGLSLHINSDRVFKCPECGHKGFCKKDN